MSEKKYSGIDEIMDEWKKEVENLKPLDIPKNCLDNGVNTERIALQRKYEQKIKDYMRESIDE